MVQRVKKIKNKNATGKLALAEPLMAKGILADKELEKVLKQVSKDITHLRKAGREWTEIRFAAACQACVEAYEDASKETVPSLKALLEEMKEKADSELQPEGDTCA